MTLGSKGKCIRISAQCSSNLSLKSVLRRVGCEGLEPQPGDHELACRALDRATVDDPKYALTILLRRVFGSGWPAAAFAAMRVELHPKVTAGIFEG